MTTNGKMIHALFVVTYFSLLVYLFTDFAHLVGFPDFKQFTESYLRSVNFNWGGPRWLYFPIDLSLGQNFDFLKFYSESLAFQNLCFFTISLITFSALPFVPEKKARKIMTFAGLLILFIFYNYRVLAVFLIGHFIAHLIFFTARLNPLRPFVAFLPLAALFTLKSLPLNFAENQSVLLATLILAWQACRLISFELDIKDNLVPQNLGFIDYLFYFANPASFCSLHLLFFGVPGYSYVEERKKAYTEKSLSSARNLLLLALFYLIFFDAAQEWIVRFLNKFSVEVHPNIRFLLDSHIKGFRLSGPTIWISVLMVQVKEFLWIAGIAHFQIGLWRLMGFDLEPMFDKPWRSTGLVELFSRYYMYMRILLSNLVLYPLFFRMKNLPLRLRMGFAICLSAGLANFFFHFYKAILISNFDPHELTIFSKKWPYYFLLTSGILFSLSVGGWISNQVKKVKLRTISLLYRLMCIFLTLEFYSMIHLFARPSSNISIGQELQVLYSAFGF